MLVSASQPRKGNRGRESGSKQRAAPKVCGQAAQSSLPAAASAFHGRSVGTTASKRNRPHTGSSVTEREPRSLEPVSVILGCIQGTKHFAHDSVAVTQVPLACFTELQNSGFLFRVAELALRVLGCTISVASV